MLQVPASWSGGATWQVHQLKPRGRAATALRGAAQRHGDVAAAVPPPPWTPQAAQRDDAAAAGAER